MCQNPGMRVTDVVKQLAKLWQDLLKPEKDYFKEQAKIDKERYEKELKELTKGVKADSKPGKPLTPYMIFVRETRPKVVDSYPGIPALDVMKEVGRLWQCIPKADLDRFKEMSRVDMNRYTAEHKNFIEEINRCRASNHSQMIQEQTSLNGCSIRIESQEPSPAQNDTPLKKKTDER